MSTLPPEPPIYRPFALLAFGAAILVGTPLGLRLLAWFYAGWPAVGPEWRLLHAHAQLFGLFATLIPGVAQHLLARFTGRPVTREPAVSFIAAALGVALALRVLGVAVGWPPAMLVATVLQLVAFGTFAWRVWQVLDVPALGILRTHLTLASGWFVVAMAVESYARMLALREGVGVPGQPLMRVVHATGLVGVLGWILGVLVRAGPMFVPGWSVAPRLARLLPLALGVAVGLVAAGELGTRRADIGFALARLGDTVALATVLAVVVRGGALRQAPGTLPVIGRSGPEARIFRLAVVSACAAAPGFALATVVALAGMPVHLLTDALRHLVTVGFAGAVVVAMALRLIPVLERQPLAWPAARAVGFWSLAGAVILRSAELLVAYLWPALAPALPLAGVLAWMAFTAVGVNVLAAALAHRA